MDLNDPKLCQRLAIAGAVVGGIGVIMLLFVPDTKPIAMFLLILGMGTAAYAQYRANGIVDAKRERLRERLRAERALDD